MDLHTEQRWRERPAALACSSVWENPHPTPNPQTIISQWGLRLGACGQCHSCQTQLASSSGSHVMFPGLAQDSSSPRRQGKRCRQRKREKSQWGQRTDHMALSLVPTRRSHPDSYPGAGTRMAFQQVSGRTPWGVRVSGKRSVRGQTGEAREQTRAME